MIITEQKYEVVVINDDYVVVEIASLQGPIGPQGPQGIQGEPGVDGAQGIQGDPGLKGDKGDTGDAGPQGIQGPAGLDGANGVDGAQGIQGPAGPQGSQGIQGIKGDTGDTGPQGIQGIQGPAGLDGADGAQGIQGIQGIKGDTGDTGAQGPQGIQGPAGLDGADSTVPGPQGPQGIQGPSGLDGADGTSAYEVAVANGFVGTEAQWLDSLVGAQGAQGIQGIKGDTGLQGPQGIQGPAGLDGADGAQGIQGVKGDTGDTGATGAQGPQGIQGPAGADGADGTNGVGVPVGGTTGQVLSKIDGTDYNTQWSTPSGGGASALNDLTDVTITTPASGNVLSYNGSGWVNSAPAGGGGGASYAIGTIIESPSAPVDGGTWLECNGAVVSQTTYASLFSAISHDYIDYTTSVVTVNGALSSTLNLAGWCNDRFLVYRVTGSSFWHSTDGITWTASSGTQPATSLPWATGGGVVCVTLNSASTLSYRSTDNGVTWASGGALPSSGVWRLSYGGGYFVGSKDGSQDICYSTDGITWSSSINALPSPTGSGKLLWTGSTWVAAGTGQLFYTSDATGSTGWATTSNLPATFASGSNTLGVAVGTRSYLFVNSNPVYITTDGGATVVPFNRALSAGGTAPFYSGYNMIVGTYGYYDMFQVCPSGRITRMPFAGHANLTINCQPGATSKMCPGHVHGNVNGEFLVGVSKADQLALCTPKCSVSTQFCVPNTVGDISWIKAT